jgi:hypothetical protein
MFFGDWIALLHIIWVENFKHTHISNFIIYRVLPASVHNDHWRSRLTIWNSSSLILFFISIHYHLFNRRCIGSWSSYSSFERMDIHLHLIYMMKKIFVSRKIKFGYFSSFMYVFDLIFIANAMDISSLIVFDKEQRNEIVNDRFNDIEIELNE